jgi:hypothetical protein
VPKERDPDTAHQLDVAHSRAALDRGRSFSTDVDFYGWPQTEVMLYLRARSPILHITTHGDGILDRVPTRAAI